MNVSSLSNVDWVEALNNHEVCPHDLIESIIENNYQFVWHPLGFAMCRVARWEGVSLRVHVWPNHTGFQQTPAWLIHDHLFHLKSWVICGEIENQEYTIELNGQDHAIYEARYEGEHSILKKTNIYCTKIINKKSVYPKGSVYEVPSGVFHESQPLSNRTTVTVCQTLDEATASPRVLGSIEGLLSYAYQRKHVTNDEICELARKI